MDEVAKMYQFKPCKSRSQLCGRYQDRFECSTHLSYARNNFIVRLDCLEEKFFFQGFGMFSDTTYTNFLWNVSIAYIMAYNHK